jgi:hypothetical protein
MLTRPKLLWERREAAVKTGTWQFGRAAMWQPETTRVISQDIFLWG